MDDVPRHRSSRNKYDGDTNRPEETAAGAADMLSSVLPLEEEDQVSTRDGQSEALGSTQQQQQQRQQAFWPSHDTQGPKRQRPSTNDPYTAVPAKRRSSFNALNAPLAASWNAATASGIAPLNAPFDSIPVADMFQGSRPSSLARSFESMGSPQPHQHRSDVVQWHSNPNDGLPFAAGQESTIEQWRRQQTIRDQRGPNESTDPVTRKPTPNLQPTHAPVATQYTSQLEVRPQSVAAASATGFMFRYAAEEKQSSPSFRQSSLSPADTPASMLAQHNQQLRQQRPPQQLLPQQQQHLLPQQQQQQQQQQQRQQLLTQQQQRQMAYNNMAPVSGTHTTGDVAAANAFDMRSPLTLQSLPFQEPMQDRPPTLSPLETLLLSNRLNSSTAPPETSLPTPPPQNLVGMLLPNSNLTHHRSSTTAPPWPTMNQEPQSTARFQVADSRSQLWVNQPAFGSRNEEQQSPFRFGQSSLPAQPTASTMAFLHQQQQQQQHQTPLGATNQWAPAPLDTASDSMTAPPGMVDTAANMRFPLMPNRTVPQSTTTTLSPLEMLYLSNRLNSSQPTVDSTPPPAPQQPQPSTASLSQLQEPPFPVVDSTSLHFRQSPSPAHAATSISSFIHQQQEQHQRERRQQMSQVPTDQRMAPLHAFGNTMVSVHRTTTAETNNMPISQPPSATSPSTEALYWIHRFNSSPSSAQPPPDYLSALSQSQQNNIGDFQPRAASEQHQPQIPQRLGDQAALVQGGFLNQPIDNASSALPPATQRRTDTSRSYTSRDDPTVVATTRAPEAAVAGATIEPAAAAIIPLPAFLAGPSDSSLMSDHQTYLRCHIQLFCATMDDVTAPVRGRTKNIQLGQVGIQCCHCAHLPLSNRVNGAVYFPATTNGIYQASLNMGAMHLQCGRCPQMPDAMKQHFTKLMGTKNMPSMVGRKYWAKLAIEMFGLVDTEHGIFVDGRTTAAAQPTTR